MIITSPVKNCKDIFCFSDEKNGHKQVVLPFKPEKQPVIITSDLEIDDMNSFIHQSLFFNEIDLEGVIVSASFCHFTGDGEHMQKEVEDHITNREEGALEMMSFRPQPLDWLPNLWNNEYAAAYEFLSQNAEGYPSPEYLTSITKIGNVQFEGDTREDTEGSDYIKSAILDDDERSLFILTWGGFNTVARALISIHVGSPGRLVCQHPGKLQPCPCDLRRDG